jgi:hypothetical protein
MEHDSLKEKFLTAIELQKEKIMVELQAVLDKYKRGDISFILNNDAETPVVACCFPENEATYQGYLDGSFPYPFKVAVMVDGNQIRMTEIGTKKSFRTTTESAFNAVYADMKKQAGKAIPFKAPQRQSEPA